MRDGGTYFWFLMRGEHHEPFRFRAELIKQ